jgi:hypothetical protein
MLHQEMSHARKKVRDKAMSANPEHLVIHPLWDKPEEKVDSDKAGPLKMTPAVRTSLIALRIYLIIIILLAIYRMLQLAGVFH